MSRLREGSVIDCFPGGSAVVVEMLAASSAVRLRLASDVEVMVPRDQIVLGGLQLRLSRQGFFQMGKRGGGGDGEGLSLVDNERVGRKVGRSRA